jgi:hypothetical protein
MVCIIFNICVHLPQSKSFDFAHDFQVQSWEILGAFLGKTPSVPAGHPAATNNS